MHLPDRSVVVVLGTRPEAVKLAGIVAALGPACHLVHTGQHWSDELWGEVVAELGMPTPDTRLNVGGQSRGVQLGRATAELDAVLASLSSARVVVVQGDTNAAASGALAANARSLGLVHVEAGLRSYDRRMPEEHNRVLVDHLSDLLCAPTQTSVDNLAAEGITEGVVITGNTVVEAVLALLPASRAELCAAQGVVPGSSCSRRCTGPRTRTTRAQLAAILADLRSLPLPVLLPLHPRTRALAPDLTGLLVRDPLPPRAFLALQAEAALVVSDSGGVQEEVTVLKRPALVVRRSTERPEAQGTFCTLVQPGASLRAAAAPLLADVAGTRARLAALPSPYGDGTASAQTVAAMEARWG